MTSSVLGDDSFTLSKLLNRTRLFFYDDSSPVNRDACLADFFTKLKCGPNETSSVLKDAASFIRDVAAFHPSVSHLLLINLPQLPDPVPFLDILPSIFSTESPLLIDEAFWQLKALLDCDSRLLVPIINVMVDLPLPSGLLAELSNITEGAITIVDESDLPALFRTLLKSAAALRMHKSILCFRDEFSSISDSSVSLMIEAMWELLPSCPSAAEVLLDQAFLDHIAMKLRQPSLMDTSIVLILTSTISTLRVKSYRLLLLWIEQGAFPFSKLHQILNLRRSNEVWDRMVPALWRLCMWTLDELSCSSWSGDASERSPWKHPADSRLGYKANTASRIGSERNGAASTAEQNLVKSAVARDGLKNLILKLCESVPSMKETIVGALLGKCTAATTTAMEHSNTGDNYSLLSCDIITGDRSICSLPPIIGNGLFENIVAGSSRGIDGSEAAKSSAKSTHDRAIEFNHQSAQQYKAHLAAGILEHSVNALPEVGGSVLTSLMSRLQPSVEGSRIPLPSPAILHR
jgi:hypothetical protein